MRAKAAITVHRSGEEVERLWRSGHYRLEAIERANAAVTFRDAPGDRGTDIHVELRQDAPGGRLGRLVGKPAAAGTLAKVKDDLRRFKQQVETGEISRSDGTPGGERVERKLKQRPAQPLEAAEAEKVGSR